MKKLIILTLLFSSCLSNRNFRTRLTGATITRIDPVVLFGLDLKRIEWTLSDGSKQYDYVNYKDYSKIGDIKTITVDK